MEQGRVRGGILKEARGEVGSSPGGLGKTTMLFGGTAAMGAHDAAEARNSFRLSDTAFKGTIGLREAETAMLHMHLEVSDKEIQFQSKMQSFRNIALRIASMQWLKLCLPPSLTHSLTHSLPPLPLSFFPLSSSLSVNSLNSLIPSSPSHSRLFLLTPLLLHSFIPIPYTHACILRL